MRGVRIGRDGRAKPRADTLEGLLLGPELEERARRGFAVLREPEIKSAHREDIPGALPPPGDEEAPLGLVLGEPRERLGARGPADPAEPRIEQPRRLRREAQEVDAPGLVLAAEGEHAVADLCVKVIRLGEARVDRAHVGDPQPPGVGERKPALADVVQERAEIGFLKRLTRAREAIFVQAAVIDALLEIDSHGSERRQRTPPVVARVDVFGGDLALFQTIKKMPADSGRKIRPLNLRHLVVV